MFYKRVKTLKGFKIVYNNIYWGVEDFTVLEVNEDGGFSNKVITFKVPPHKVPSELYTDSEFMEAAGLQYLYRWLDELPHMGTIGIKIAEEYFEFFIKPIFDKTFSVKNSYTDLYINLGDGITEVLNDYYKTYGLRAFYKYHFRAPLDPRDLFDILVDSYRSRESLRVGFTASTLKWLVEFSELSSNPEQTLKCFVKHPEEVYHVMRLYDRLTKNRPMTFYQRRLLADRIKVKCLKD